MSAMKLTHIALAAISAAVAVTAVAQDAYPTKPVTIVVPFPPGGGTDTGARWIAQKLSDKWRQPVVVDNKPGAAGMIGADFVARAKPDGYTIMMTNAQVAVINPSLYKKLPHNPDTAFVPISLVAELPLVLLVNPSVPASSTKEFTPVGGTAAQFQALIDADSARYRKIIIEKNISATE
jgi:tripartite-type tricarboxylate transporter receptor subunit TctC